MPVFLITDVLFFLLLACVLGYFGYALRRPHLMRPWRKLSQSRIALIATSVILFYVGIAFLDSLHFKPKLEQTSEAQHEIVYSNEVWSVLDWLFKPIRERQEKTYSSPFALHLYVKETVSSEEGATTARTYPRLQYGGAHLERVEERSRDIQKTVLEVLWQAVLWAVLAFFILCLLQARRSHSSVLHQARRFLTHAHTMPLRTVLYTFFVLIVLSLIAYQLSLSYHILGTDKVGEDVFYQAVKSIRTGVLIGTLTTLIMLPFALLLGIAAGYFLGRIDDIIQYIYTTLNSIPGVLLIAAAVLMLHLYMEVNAEVFDNLTVRADTRLFFLCVILGITSWTGLCRLLRAETLKVKGMDYILAAQAFGVRTPRILLRHVLPNVMHIVFITVALDFSGLVLAEAVLSYVNIGVDPTMYSWGNMINGARLEMAREPVVWWSLIGAFVFMFILVLCANLFADGMRDAFDPKTEGTWR